LAVPTHGYHGRWRIWYVTPTEAWTCAVCIAAGFAFAWWARVHLGELWSGPVTAKANHRVVATGPYGLVRHPIYTGILLSVFATAAIKGTLPGVAGALVITLGIWMKARLEEKWLAGELGADSYMRYRERVPMLVPVPWGRR
jgi:protein-S-isoprenylcysteine O-methyltransferase Ste14